ncbi:hypothetical protein N0V86_007904 [Didymella sp. IMI 355093]|nr:hypothetical protein N0V86_007904 [Didymella sp. IMI 355093]
MMEKQLVEFEETILDLTQKLKTAEVQAKNSATEVVRVRKDKDERVREEHTTLTKRLHTAELKTDKHDETAAMVLELEKQIK